MGVIQSSLNSGITAAAWLYQQTPAYKVKQQEKVDELAAQRALKQASYIKDSFTSSIDMTKEDEDKLEKQREELLLEAHLKGEPDTTSDTAAEELQKIYTERYNTEQMLASDEAVENRMLNKAAAEEQAEREAVLKAKKKSDRAALRAERINAFTEQLRNPTTPEALKKIKIPKEEDDE